MKNILYATDFSKNAENAFVYALSIAKKIDAKLLMLHVHDIPTTWEYSHITDFTQIDKKIKKDTIKKFEALLQKNKVENKENISFLEAENKSVTKGILYAIKENEIDLLVIGTRGESKLYEIIVGSTTKAMISKSPCAVLAIPENSITTSFKNIVYTTDFMDKDLEAIQQLIELVKPFNPKITIAHVIPSEEKDGEKLLNIFKKAIVKNINYDDLHFQPLLSNTIYDRLNSYVKQNDFDLLVMLEKEKEGFLKKLFIDDTVKKMEFHTSMPLLSFNEHYLNII